MSKPETITIDERFAKYVKVDELTGCFLWCGANTTKYGVFWNGAKYISTHRFAWIRANGEIPKGMNVVINVIHLYVLILNICF